MRGSTRRSMTFCATLAVLCSAGTVGAQPDDTARLRALEQRLATLEHEVERREDLKAIRRLQRAYGYYLDEGLGRELAELFADAPDTSVEYGQGGVYVGKERVREYLLRLVGDDLPDGRLFNHFVLQGVVHLAPDGNTARGRWRALIQTGEHGDSATWAEGPYENEYVKDGGVWKIHKVHWYQTVSAPYEPGWHLAPEPAAGPLEDFPPDRPPTERYESYPGVHMPAYHFANPVSGRCEAGSCTPADEEAAPARAANAAAPGAENTAARLAEARERLAAVNTRAARVADVNEIQNLQGRYGYYYDKMLWEHVLDLLTADARLEIGPSGVYIGKDSIREYLYSLSGGVEGPLEGVLFNHMQLQPVITVAGDGQSARGRWHTLMLLGEHGQGRGGRWGEGVYENEYVNEDGVWKIASIHLYPTFVASYDGGWLEVDDSALAEYAMGRGVEPDAPPSDPDYDPYPAADIAPYHYVHPVTGEPVTPQR